MDVNTALKKMLKTGQLEFGYRRGVKNLLAGNAKAVIIASEGPERIKSDIIKYASAAGVPVLNFPGTSLELGRACGKPFLISTITVLNPGDVSVKEVEQ